MNRRVINMNKVIDNKRYWEYTRGKSTTEGDRVARDVTEVAEVAMEEFWKEWTKDASAWLVVDVREPEEHQTGIIPGAVRLPLGQLEQRYRELPAHRAVALICRSGRRSEEATRFLLQKHYRAVNIAGGMLAWPGPIEVPDSR